MTRARPWLAAIVLAAVIAFAAPANAAGWNLKVGSWNVMNFGQAKSRGPGNVPRAQLLQTMGAIAVRYDVVVFQEVLQDGRSVTQDLIAYMPNYACQAVSGPSGRAGRQERYVVCSIAANATGAIAVAVQQDYSTVGGNFTAGNGTQQPAGNVWSRPPYVVQVTYTPNDVTFPPVTFSVYTIHTMPNYKLQRPAGTPANANQWDSVHYELRGIGQNLIGGANKMVIGDLNADCASYPTRWRVPPADLPPPGWTWYVGFGQKTNTALGVNCGYDRVILNTTLNAYYRSHGVDYPGYGPATRINTKLVSDHYPVWVVLGQQQGTKHKLFATAAMPVSQGNAQTKFNTGTAMQMGATGLKPNLAAAKFFVTPSTTTHSYNSNATFALSDVRGQPTAVTTDANGNLQQAVTWASAAAGAYTFVFDANGDGVFRLKDGDFANEDMQADVYVGALDGGHNTLVTLGDNMLSRDVFDLNQAANVYLLAKSLPASVSGYAYIVSNALLKAAGYADWAAARTARIDLPTFSIPIQKRGVITTATLTADDRRQAFKATADGQLFMSVWYKPGELMNATVNYTSPSDSVFTTALPTAPDPPDSPDVTDWSDDSCIGAANSTSANYRAACNIGFGFGDYYGHSFTVVLDVNGNGTLDPTDPIGTRDVGDMTTYFAGPGSPVLGPTANGNPAVSEWKEYLNRALSVNLSANATYDADTQAAARRYACGSLLSKAAFQSWIVPDAQTGFRILDDSTYRSQRATATGLYQYDVASLGGIDVSSGDVCVTGGDITYNGSSTINGSRVTSVADSHHVLAPVQLEGSSSLCLSGTAVSAGGLLAFGAGASVATGPFAPFAAIASLVAAGGVLINGVLTCGGL